MTGYAGKTVFITGGASGMGLETACQLAAAGAHVVIFNRQAQAAAHALQRMETCRAHPSQRFASVLLDVAERDEVIDGFASATRDAGTPDLVIHMAGIGGLAPLVETPPEAFDRIVKINLYGTWHVAEASISAMRAGGRGHLVLAGSLGGFVPVPGYTAYGASKFAVVGLAQCLRYELAPLGLRLTCFCPGEVETPGLRDERAQPNAAASALKAIGGTIEAGPAVRALLKGIRHQRFLVIPGWRAKLVYALWQLTPLPLWHLMTDALIAWRTDPAPDAPSHDARSH